MNDFLYQLLMNKGMAPTAGNAATKSALGIMPGEIGGMPIMGGPKVAGMPLGKPSVAGASKPAGKQGFVNKLEDALGTGLLPLGLQLLANSGPSTTPTSFGQVLGKSLMGAQQQQQQQLMSRFQRDMLERQYGLDKRKADLDERKVDIEERKLSASGALGQEDINKLVNELGDDVFSQSKQYIQQKDAFGRIMASAQDPSGAGDLALIFNYMKVLDPGSTVREGEFASAENSAGVSQRLRGLYNKIVRGERLSDPQRKDFVNRAQRLFNSAVETQQERNEKFRKRGLNSGLTEEYISPILPSADLVDITPFDPRLLDGSPEDNTLPDGETYLEIP